MVSLYLRGSVWWARWSQAGSTLRRSTRCRDEEGALRVARAFVDERLASEIQIAEQDRAAGGPAASRRAWWSEIGWVYFIQADAGDELIKIGFTTDLKRRLDGLRFASPVGIGLCGVMRGSRRDERILHDRFAAHRHHGEWFHADEEIVAFILAHAQQFSETGVAA